MADQMTDGDLTEIAERHGTRIYGHHVRAEWAYYEIPALIAEVRRLRAERTAMLGASAEAMRWTCQVAGHPRQAPTDSRCICATWATHVDRGAVEIECGNEGGEDG